MNVDPFPHLILPGAVSSELCRAAMAEWPGDDWIHWHNYGNRKRATKDADRLTPACKELIRDAYRLPIGKLTGVSDVFPDTSLYGAGMHSIPPGSDLGRHLDSDTHPQGWERAFSAVVFLDPDWRREWGGAMQLWSGNEVSRSIRPQAGTVVVFAASDESWHSVERISDESPRSRNTLAIFWWRTQHGHGKRLHAEFHP